MQSWIHYVTMFSFIIDNAQFYGVLIQHIYNVLCERDEVHEDEKEWVFNEAINVSKLRDGGTFRNALSRKVDSVIIPIFSEIIAAIDRNYNLDLIDSKNENPQLSQFFLDLFCDSSIMQFNYNDMITPREQVPGVGGRKTGEDFKGEMPFSWLIHEAVWSQWSNTVSLGKHLFSLLDKLCL